MKKLLLLLAAIALLVWILSWFRVPGAVATSAARTWPANLGTLDSVPNRMKPVDANAAVTRLAALAKALPKNDAIDELVAREVGRGELAIEAPPALPDVSAIRELLLREPLVWERGYEVGDANASAMRPVQLTVARTLVATALAKARLHDPSAWEDLHAVWNLARSLEGHPQMMSATAALSMVRMINGVAWKMPLPVPAWFADELQARDPLRPLLEAYQYQTASYWQDGASAFPTKMLADSVEHDRRIAEEVFATTRCDVTVPMNDLGTDLSSVWRRAFRYRAEREATANALRVRSGEPIVTASRCTDGGWAYDGTTLRFSRAIATATPDRPMPLVLRVQP